MHPILFEIPGLGFPIRSFGVMVVAGFLVASSLLTRLAARYADDPEKEAPGFAALPVWILVGILIGARLLYVVVEVAQGSAVGKAYIDDPLKIFAYWEGGLVMYGGLAGGIAAGWRCARKHGLRPLNALDLALVVAFVGLSIGRIGCLLVGDDYGRALPEGSHLPFPIAIRVPDPLPADSLFGEHNAGRLLYATQIWMSANALCLSLFAWLVLRHRRYAGQVALWVLLGYALTRSTIEHFRGDAVRGLWFGGAISTSQVISLVLGVTCIVLLVKNRGRSDGGPGARLADT